MPGAYEKPMFGEQYEAMVAAVERCNNLVKDMRDTGELLCELSNFLLLQSDKSKTSLERFCYAGGFFLMFKIIDKLVSDETKHDALLLLIENNISSLFAIEYDPFDEDLGELPILAYFLCERHTHYIDICWVSQELTLMAAFMKAHLAIIMSNTSSRELLDLALHNLYTGLITYPPHRVVSNAARCLSAEACSQLFNIGFRQNMRYLFESPEGLMRLSQLIFAMAAFGLGPVIAADLPLSQSMLHVNRLVLPALRCACFNCEHYRRLQRLVREHDEFGVPKATEDKREVARNMIEGGLPSILAEILNAVANTSFQTPCENLAPLGQNKGQNISPCFPQPKPRSENEPTAPRLVSRADWEALCSSSDHVDRTRIYCSLSIMLCSWANENKDTMASSNWTLLSEGCLVESLLKNIPLKDFRSLLNPGQEWELNYGIRLIIQVLCTISLRTIQDRTISSDLICKIRPTIEVVLHRSAELMNSLCGPLAREWNPSMGGYAPLFAVMLATVYIGYLQSQPSSSQKQGRKRVLRCLATPLLQCIATTCQTLVDGYQYRGCSSVDHRVFIMSVLQAMAIPVGCIELGHCESEVKRRLLPVPEACCGPFANNARWLMDKFLCDVVGKEDGSGCVAIRTLSSLVIARAEKAVALVTPSEASALNKQSELLLTTANHDSSPLAIESSCPQALLPSIP